MIIFSFELICAGIYSLILLILNLLLFFFIKNLLQNILFLQRINNLFDVYKINKFSFIFYLYQLFYKNNKEFLLLKKMGQVNYNDFIIIGNTYKLLLRNIKNNNFFKLLKNQCLKEN